MPAAHACYTCDQEAQFAEAEGFHHVHFHVIPRAADLPRDLRGPDIFELLRRPSADRVQPKHVEEVAAALHEHLTQ
ncbi:MAG: hypothetical protein ACR2KG_10635 [Nocardioidaceae bacterium]